MIKTAVLGYGTVGSGGVKVFDVNKDAIAGRIGDTVEVKYILDLREFPGDPNSHKVVHDYEVILNDPEIRVIAEVMGGVEPAHTFVKKALMAGKSAVTSNKEMVALYGAELLAVAREHHVNFLFEASVGGGIPVIRPLTQALLADQFEEVTGILNGTTNYMLTKMDAEGADYDTVLKQAQDNGYAERHPEADVEGFDACRKIAILTSLVCGRQVNYEEIPTEGITKITETDFKYADALGAGIKLLGTSRMTPEGVFAKVSPVLIPESHPLYPVRDVFNAILVKGNMLGDVMFYGKGAGSEPTASAVVSDMLTCLRYEGCTLPIRWAAEAQPLADPKKFPSRFLVRVKGDPQARAEDVRALFGDVSICTPEGVEGEFAVLTREMTLGEAEEACEKLEGFAGRLFADL